MKMHTRAVVAVLAVLSLIAVGCGGNGGGDPSEPIAGADEPTDGEEDGAGVEGEPIRIGLIVSLSGPAASFGDPIRNAANVVADQINEKGGVLGRPIELLERDDATDPTRAAQLATELIEEDVVAIIGSVTSSTTLAFAPIAARAEVPVLGIAGAANLTDPDTDFYDWMFRNAPNDGQAIPAIFERAVADGHERIAVFAQEDAYGEFGLELYGEFAEDEDGVEIVADANAALDATDVTPQATRLRDADPDVILLQLSSVGLASSFLRAAEQVGLDVPMLGGTGLAQRALIDNAGDAAELIAVTNMINPHDLTAMQQQLYDLLDANGHTPALGFADTSGANGVAILAAAIEEAGEASGPAIRDALESGLSIEAYARAPYQYGPDDHDGLPMPEGIVFTTVRDGQFVADE